MLVSEEKIALAKDMKRCAVEVIGISENPSFERVSENGSPFHVLYVSSKDCLDYPGVMPNINFDSLEEAQKEKKHFEKKGYDTYIRSSPVIGLEDCCDLTSSVLESEVDYLSYMVFHENYHIFSSEKNMGFGWEIEESICDLFAHKASIQYFKEKNPEIVTVIDDYFTSFFEYKKICGEFIEKLEEAYEESVEKGRELLRTAREELTASLSLNPWGKILDDELNNAWFLMEKQYCYLSDSINFMFKDFSASDLIDVKKVKKELKKFNFI